MILILRASFVAAAATLVCLALAACSEGPAAPSATTPQEVGVLSLEPAPLAVIRELPGRIAPTRIAEVRARVSGIVVSRNFEQGSDVKAGDVLYRLDARPSKSSSVPRKRPCQGQRGVDQETQNDKRMETLAPSAPCRNRNSTSPSQISARPRRTSPHARPTSHAPSSISNTEIRAPISGRIGRALVTEGALVGQSDADACGHDPAARSDLCRLHPIGRRAEPAAARIRYRRA